MTLEEIRFQDGEMFSVVDRDIECIKGAIEELELSLMHEVSFLIGRCGDFMVFPSDITVDNEG